MAVEPQVFDLLVHLIRHRDQVVSKDDLLAFYRSELNACLETPLAAETWTVLEKAGISGLAANFLQLVARNRRLFAVRDMVKAYRLHANSYLVKPGSYEHFVELMAEVERYWLRQNMLPDDSRSPSRIA